jgi:histone H3/H4
MFFVRFLAGKGIYQELAIVMLEQLKKTAPTKQQWIQECATEEGAPASANSPQRYIVSSTPNQTSNSSSSSINLNKVTSSMQNEVLVVVSKMKQYVKDIADMNTSGDVATVLSEMIRKACDQAVEQARRDGRKTVMARDFTMK